MSNELWCIYLAGPDDLVAMPTKAVAEAVARNFNAVWDRYGAERGHNVRAVAHAEPWMHGKEAHAKDLREHFHEYADLVLDEDAGRFLDRTEPAPPVEAVDERAKFEKWALQEHGAWLEKDTHGRYNIPAEESMWMGWQAALAHPRPTVTPEPRDADLHANAPDEHHEIAREVWEHMNRRSAPGVIMAMAYAAVLRVLASRAPTGDAKVLTTQSILDRIEAVARQADSAMQSGDERHLRSTLEIVADDLTSIIAAERVHAPTGEKAGEVVDWTDDDVETLRNLRNAVGKYANLKKLWVPTIEKMLARARHVENTTAMPYAQPRPVGVPDGAVVYDPADADMFWPEIDPDQLAHESIAEVCGTIYSQGAALPFEFTVQRAIRIPDAQVRMFSTGDDDWDYEVLAAAPAPGKGGEA